MITVEHVSEDAMDDRTAREIAQRAAFRARRPARNAARWAISRAVLSSMASSLTCSTVIMRPNEGRRDLAERSAHGADDRLRLHARGAAHLVAAGPSPLRAPHRQGRAEDPSAARGDRGPSA